MKNLIKVTVFSLVTIATIIPMLPTAAQADDWRQHRYYRGSHDYGYDRGDAVALGAIGLATGMIVGGAVASQPYYRERVYVAPAPEYYAPHPVYRRPRPVAMQTYNAPEPWSGRWYNYCENRYRSFNSRTGTFVGYDGRKYFCTGR
ncbi:BA14K family protein [Agrobacterium rhizogenes]|uniref:BA14K family protein n=1 Tax=Rhizobium rhizogenes TaxID=359 RepID=UPI00115D0888|nr:BA14K family protein [Rhizobium rhizogenes]NTG90860.1 BA14K family protein [Rhizobium rhizogenes]NTI20133.1 BA14K family protein [Rhizobium rhizogenes]NTI39182.1 BA14K family protein [Rhizobium rhizogenes]TRB19857.1 BA14K family protein [Rhizobium rhizogenes]WEO69106.1 BA14K family protein [Rhizobium rhizogenes]